MEKNKNIWVLGDIHGQYEKLVKVIELSNIDKENDILITLGDIVDRGDDFVECIQELNTFKNHIPIRGNHDSVFLHYIKTGVHFLKQVLGLKNQLNNIFMRQIKERLKISLTNKFLIILIMKIDCLFMPALIQIIQLKTMQKIL